MEKMERQRREKEAEVWRFGYSKNRKCGTVAMIKNRAFLYCALTVAHVLSFTPRLRCDSAERRRHMLSERAYLAP